MFLNDADAGDETVLCIVLGSVFQLSTQGGELRGILQLQRLEYIAALVGVVAFLGQRMTQAPDGGLWKAGHADNFLWSQLRLFVAEAAQDLQTSGQGGDVLSILFDLGKRGILPVACLSVPPLVLADIPFMWCGERQSLSRSR